MAFEFFWIKIDGIWEPQLWNSGFILYQNGLILEYTLKSEEVLEWEDSYIDDHHRSIEQADSN